MDNKINLYNLTSYVQSNTLLNRGLLEAGGVVIPQIIMSNNSNEAFERGALELIYSAIAFLSPLFFLPKFNKYFLKKSGIVKDFNGVEKKILEVSKKYLTKDAELMIKGINETAHKLDKGKDTHTKAFNKILERFQNKEELRQRLLKTHQNIYTSDFLTTAWMLGISPWIIQEYTEHKTNKKGYSGAFNLKEQDFDEKKYKSEKHIKMALNILVATIPAIVVPKIVTKAIGKDIAQYLKSQNLFKKSYGKFLNAIKKNASNFDYTNSIFMSKTIFALIWLFSDYPNGLICSRDKYERKDRAIRYGAMNLMFFGGDLVLNGIFGKLADKYLGTKIMNGWQMKSLSELGANKNLNRTKNIAKSIYWMSLFINMAFLGFGLPSFLNKMLRHDITNEKTKEKQKPLKDDYLYQFLNMNKIGHDFFG